MSGWLDMGNPKDAALVASLSNEYYTMPGMRVGDYIRFHDGSYWRISHDWGDSVQFSGVNCGSFYLSGRYASFSGSLEPSIPVEEFEATDEYKDGEFWTFPPGRVGAGQGKHFIIRCRVFRCMNEKRTPHWDKERTKYRVYHHRAPGRSNGSYVYTITTAHGACSAFHLREEYEAWLRDNDLQVYRIQETPDHSPTAPLIYFVGKRGMPEFGEEA